VGIAALNWRVWAVLGALFLYALVRRLVRQWTRALQVRFARLRRRP
jgi:hypothetical protein